ncbi:uncharacterized protein SPPG_08045 [Spizellomyces punctatus DAOM BR117]|uniref:Thiaminase-2/PQQC domain-containing protein n=1 Tax=Spizellomyces punctatus (strain DAOM BR117) TaxID=645134 RepID=A0A0L0H6U4_SPIPD|nr:uncharacterized protein SPPG_08045 [Spizellomyces punctatus DAOM BR117]KNC96453.1 hypothetical protein SPPG_08045 [Spizellomyces punctatus DAOM BR117]|eukprot:XP_016604493.1 hypothetical protein SPPG_08045 [Spizellomyces punctatus DAOM BR117]
MSSNTCNRLLQKYSDRYKDAVNHVFLKRVADSTADEAFEKWLIQDFHFVVAYLKFLSIVLSRVPSDASPETAEGLTKGFLSALGEISKEALFFRDQASSMNIKLGYTDDSLGETFRKYIDYLIKVANESSFPEVLITLWAVEKVYLDSWSYAAELVPLNRPNKYDRFIKHWANADFAKFVGWLETIANDATPEITPEIEDAFRTVVEFEVQCWDTALGTKDMASR